jgi:hypothetical protein
MSLELEEGSLKLGRSEAGVGAIDVCHLQSAQNRPFDVGKMMAGIASGMKH